MFVYMHGPHSMPYPVYSADTKSVSLHLDARRKAGGRQLFVSNSGKKIMQWMTDFTDEKGQGEGAWANLPRAAA